MQVTEDVDVEDFAMKVLSTENPTRFAHSIGVKGAVSAEEEEEEELPHFHTDIFEHVQGLPPMGIILYAHPDGGHR